MIEGLHLDFTARELKAHCEDRELYHLGRAEWYTGQADQLREGMETEQLKKFGNATGGDPLANLELSAKQHTAKANLFEMVRTHLVEGETYRLSESDCRRIDLL